MGDHTKIRLTRAELGTISTALRMWIMTLEDIGTADINPEDELSEIPKVTELAERIESDFAAL